MATVPVNLTGLKANTTYRFSLYGWPKDSSTSQLLTTTVVKTPGTKKIQAVMEEVKDGGTNALNAKIYFKTGTDGTASSYGQYEAHKIQSAHFTLKQGNRTIGTYTCLLYTSSCMLRYSLQKQRRSEASGCNY